MELTYSYQAFAFDHSGGGGVGLADSAHELTCEEVEPVVEASRPAFPGIGVRLAESAGHRGQASYLLTKMYGWRGYSTTEPLPDDPNRLTLVLTDGDRVAGTLTVGVDTPAGLSAEALYPDEVAKLRKSGARICEVTRFALDRSSDSLDVVAMMFHVVYLFARRRFSATHLVVEVNPRHERFYRRMLGFEPYGPERFCARVGAPAVLLLLSLDWCEKQIARYGGRPELGKSVRSLYPRALSRKEEEAVASRIFAGEFCAWQ